MITSEIVVAYSQCILKAYLLLSKKKEGTTHEYVKILERETEKNRQEYLSSFRNTLAGGKPYSYEKMKEGIPILIEANLEFEIMKAYADILTRVDKVSLPKNHHYIPVLVVGTHKISKEQKLQLGFIGYVTSKLQKEEAVSGIIIGKGNKPHRIKLTPLNREIESILKELKSWVISLHQESPPIILNKHCPLCPFRYECEEKALESDHLSLLNKISTICTSSKHMAPLELFSKRHFSARTISSLAC
jgi:predicted RecB family nuclease